MNREKAADTKDKKMMKSHQPNEIIRRRNEITVYAVRDGYELEGIPITKAELPYLEFSSNKDHVSVVIVEDYSKGVCGKVLRFGRACKDKNFTRTKLLYIEDVTDVSQKPHRENLVLHAGRPFVQIGKRYFDVVFSSQSSEKVSLDLVEWSDK